MFTFATAINHQDRKVEHTVDSGLRLHGEVVGAKSTKLFEINLGFDSFT